MVTVGIDEVGRGCWAGPLVAAAVALNTEQPIAGLNDSKKLSRLQREKLALLIRAEAVAVGIGWVWPEAIDISGITQAVKAAMEGALKNVLQQLGSTPDEIIIDGNYNFLPDYEYVTTIVKADGLIPAVSAASIIAKVARDTYMSDIAAIEYPGYGFENHVGYGTAAHIRALMEHGVAQIHRTSFKPIKNYLIQS